MEPDQYEKQYMGGERVIARDRRGIPWWFHLLFLIPLLSISVAGLATGQWAILTILPVFLMLWLLFMFLRVTVSSSHVHVQYGLFGPKIPIEKITSVKVGQYDWKRFGGWGIKRAMDGTWAYSTPGGTTMALEVTYTAEDGAARSVCITSDSARELADGIQEAMRAMGASGTTRLRVAETSESTSVTERAQETQEAGETAATRERRS